MKILHPPKTGNPEFDAWAEYLAMLLSDNIPEDLVFADGKKIEIDKIQARNGDGLFLVDDGGSNGLEITDGGIWHGAKQSGCSAYRSADETIPSGSFVLPTLDSEYWDIQNEFNTTTHKFTATKAGKYIATFAWYIQGLADEDAVGAMIYKNVAAGPPHWWIYQGAAGDSGGEITQIFDLAANDTLEPRIRQDSGANKTLLASYTSFAIAKVA